MAGPNQESSDEDDIFVQPFRLSFWDGSEMLRSIPDVLVRQLLAYCIDHDTSVPSCVGMAWPTSISLSHTQGKPSQWVAGSNDNRVEVSRFRYAATSSSKRQIVIAQDQHGHFNAGQPGIVVSMRCRYRLTDHGKKIRRSRWVLWTPQGVQEDCYIERLTGFGIQKQTIRRPYQWRQGYLSAKSDNGQKKVLSDNIRLDNEKRASVRTEVDNLDLNPGPNLVCTDTSGIVLVLKSHARDVQPFRMSFQKCNSVGKLFAYALRERKITRATLMMEIRVGQHEPMILIRDDTDDFEKVLSQVNALSRESDWEMVAMPLQFE